MALLNTAIVNRILAIQNAGHSATVWMSSNNTFDSAEWQAHADGTVSCDVEGIKTYFDPAFFLAVRVTPGT